MLTAGIRRVDREGVTRAVEAWAASLAARPEVRRVVWYGSFIGGVPTPRSDVDVCVVVHGAAGEGPRHTRGADFLPAAVTPAPFDLTVLSEHEFDALAEWAPSWARAIAGGRVLLAR